MPYMAMPIAVPTMPDSASGESQIRVVAELARQAIGHPEDAAERADVLAEDHHVRVVGHRVAQRGGQRAGHRESVATAASAGGLGSMLGQRSCVGQLPREKLRAARAAQAAGFA